MVPNTSVTKIVYKKIREINILAKTKLLIQKIRYEREKNISLHLVVFGCQGNYFALFLRNPYGRLKKIRYTKSTPKKHKVIKRRIKNITKWSTLVVVTLEFYLI